VNIEQVHSVRRPNDGRFSYADEQVAEALAAAL